MTDSQAIARNDAEQSTKGPDGHERPRALRRRGMASGSKRKTTMAKLNRERRLLERRQEKQAKKAARKQAAADARATHD